MNRTHLYLIFIVLYNIILTDNLSACTNILVTKNASIDGSTMIAHTADNHNLYGELYYIPAKDYPVGSMLDIYDRDSGEYLGQIPQVQHTYSVIGYMNEFQVTIGETTFTGREELRDTTGILDYKNLIFIALQRSKSAREAIKTMTSLVQKYGYYSTGESFSIADPNEVWIMEMIGKGPGNKGANWVARLIPDGMVCAHANQSRITTFPLNDPDICIYSKDIIEFAEYKGYFSGNKKEFSFSDAFAPLDYGALRFCEARVWSAFLKMNNNMDEYQNYAMGKSVERMPLFIKPNNKVSTRDIMAIMRDHFEGTPLDMTEDVGAGPYKVPYRFRPLTWYVDSVQYFNERAIATQQTAFTFVSQMRNWLDNPIGGVLWFGVDDANTTVYVPMYCGITQPPPSYAAGNGDLLTFTWKSAFWVFNWVSNQSYTRYSLMIKDIRKVQKSLEDKFEQTQPAIEQTARMLYNQSPDLARQFLTEYSNMQAELTMNKYRDLGQFLFVKYLDGNLHEEKDGKFLRNPSGKPSECKHPGYDQHFYEQIVKDTGDKLKMKKIGETEHH